MRPNSGLLGFALTGMLALSVAPARADEPSTSDAAKALFREGRALASDSKYEQACPKFEQSLKLDPGIGTKFNLADCYEHVGRAAAARQLFLEVATIAREAGQADRERVAAERARALEPQVHTLTIDVKAKSGGLTILRDGVEVAPSKWGAPQPVDPGTYELKVSAPGKKPWSTHVDVPRSGDVTIAVPELEDAAPEKEATPVKEESAAASPAPPPEADKSARPAPVDLTVPILIYGGLGAGAILGGTALILYKSANDKAAGICVTNHNCSAEQIQQHQGLVNDARDARTLAYVGLGVAGAAAITGGIIALVRSHPETPPSQASVTAGPLVTSGGFGAAMEGKF